MDNIFKVYKVNKYTKKKFTRKLYCMNISKNASEKDVETLFSPFGKVKKVKLWNGSFLRQGNITFYEPVELINIQIRLSGLPFMGDILLVREKGTKIQVTRDYCEDNENPDIFIYSYEYCDFYCDRNRLKRFIHYIQNAAEVEENEVRKEGDTRGFINDMHTEIVQPHLEERMKNSWPIFYSFRGKTEYKEPEDIYSDYSENEDN